MKRLLWPSSARVGKSHDRFHSTRGQALFAAAVAVPVFLLDVFLPSSITIDVLYALSVLCALRTPSRSVVLGIAALCSGMSLVGSMYVVGDPPDWVLIAQNGLLAQGVIWVTAVVGLRWWRDQRALLESEKREKERAEQLRELSEKLEERVDVRTRELRQLGFELAQAEHRERAKLGQILHDDIQQMLVALKVHLEQLKHAGRESLSDEVDQASAMVDETIESTRTLSHELSPTILEIGGLSEALHWLTTRKYEKYGLQLQVEADRAAEPTEELKVILFQAVRELLLNVAKHAGVSEATVTLFPDGAGWLCLTVSDQGRGFDYETERTRPGGGAYLGLFGMRERLAALGGSMQGDSAPGRGTTVRLWAPLPSASPGAAAGCSAEDQLLQRARRPSGQGRGLP